MAIELKSLDAVEDTEELSTGRDHTRDDFQKQIDADVAALVKLWDEQHNPEVGKGAPTKRYVVSTTDRAEMRKVIDRAFTLASRERTPKVAAGWYQAKVNDGTVALKFAPKFVVKAEANGQTETPDESQPEQATVHADQGTDQPQAEQSSRRAFGRR